MKERAIAESWRRLATLASLLESAARDVREGARERKPWRVAIGLSSVASAIPEGFRLLGHFDQLEGDKDE